MPGKGAGRPPGRWAKVPFLAAASRCVCVSIMAASAALVPAYDTSGHGLVVWDSVHLVAVARDGYRYEHQLAFFPLYPMLMRLLALW